MWHCQVAAEVALDLVTAQSQLESTVKEPALVCQQISALRMPNSTGRTGLTMAHWQARIQVAHSAGVRRVHPAEALRHDLDVASAAAGITKLGTLQHMFAVAIVNDDSESDSDSDSADVVVPIRLEFQVRTCWRGCCVCVCERETHTRRERERERE